MDLRLFSRGNPNPPGVRRVDLFVNGEWRGRRDVSFELPEPHAQAAEPCVDAGLLETLGLQRPATMDGQAPQTQAAGCTFIDSLVPGASMRFDPARQQLDVQAPQALLSRRRAQADPARWDEGITAATLQYDYTGFGLRGPGTVPYASHYLGLRSGLRWGRWRGRFAGGLGAEGGHMQFTPQAAQVETALPDLSSRLVLGDVHGEGRAFEGLNLRGLQFGTDTRMLPDGQRDPSPVVRGVARSSALVTVRQQQAVVHQQALPPGPFVLEDLSASGNGGDLLVTLTESDGSQQAFTVPNSQAPEALPPGRLQYSLALGTLREPAAGASPWAATATGGYGVSDRATVLAGLLATTGYQAASAGMALNTGWGAVSAAWAHSRSRLPGQAPQDGDRLSFFHAKYLPDSFTSLSVSGHVDTRRGYVSPALALAPQPPVGLAGSVPPPGGPVEPRARLRLNLSQALAAGWGSLGVMADTQWRWGEPGSESDFQLNYLQNAGPFALGLTVARTRDGAGMRGPLQISATVSLALDSLPMRPRLATTATAGSPPKSLNTSLSGSLGEDQSLSYTVYLSRQGSGPDAEGGPSSGSRSAGGLVNWAAPAFQLGAGLSTAPGGARQYSASASGGGVLYGGGWVWARELGDTLAVVEARHAGGARVAGWAGLRLDAEGRGVVPHLQPYRPNEVGVDPQGLPPGVGILGSFKKVAPTAGAVVLLRFDTEAGHSLLASGRLANGRPLPFGAQVQDVEGRPVGHIAQGGQALLRLADTQGRLTVVWGESEAQRCSFGYVVPQPPRGQGASADAPGLPRLDVLCS